MSIGNVVAKDLSELSLSADEFEALAEKLSQQARELRHVVKNGDVETARQHKYQALDTAQSIVSMLKDPSTQWIDSQSSISLITAIGLFIKWKAFDAIPTEGGITYKELSEKVAVQHALLRRVGWMMVSMGVLKQEGADRVLHTPRSLNYRESEHGADFHKSLFNLAYRTFPTLPAYFDEYGHKEPEEQKDIPVTWAYGTPELTFWQHLEKHPDQIEPFMRAIAPSLGRMPITGIYDFGWVVEKAKDPSFDPERVLFVDVGGGTGHCIVAIHGENPGIPLERFMLQDQYKIIEELKASTPETLKGVQMLGLDFNMESPHKGGLVYWLRRVLHDYSDKLAVKILKSVVAAMAEDSRILVAEDVASNPPHFMTAMMDMMMLVCAGKERTMEDFEAIIAEAGLKVLSVSRNKETPMAIIECVKA